MDFLWQVHECELLETNPFGRIQYFARRTLNKSLKIEPPALINLGLVFCPLYNRSLDVLFFHLKFDFFLIVRNAHWKSM